jgi:hypothetical protein
VKSLRPLRSLLDESKGGFNTRRFVAVDARGDEDAMRDA